MVIIVAGAITTLALLGQVTYLAHKARYSRMRGIYTKLAFLAFQLACINVVIFCFIYALHT